MLYRHKLHQLAHIDIIEAYAWYEDQKENLGEEFAITIQKKINEIVVNPHIYGSKSRINYREALVKKFPYIIVYKVDDNKREIIVVSIHHVKKHPKSKYRK